MSCNGTRCVTIKTLHGAFAFVVQRFQCPLRGETTDLELTEQLCEGAISARLALRATSEGEQHAPERRLEGEASPQDECAWLRNAMVIHKKRA